MAMPAPGTVTRAAGEVRLLVVGAAPSALASLAQWAAEDAVTLASAPDLPRAARQLSGGTWHVVLAVLGERCGDELDWWVDTLRGVAGAPRLIAAAERPTMGLALRAEKLGVVDLLALP
ncbi:MAG: hypothetical protein ACREMJ_03950, partial [Gemmatimonadales bacterium]